MKLIKIYLTSLAFLYLNSLLSSDPKIANTGADKATGSSLTSKSCESVAIADHISYPTLTAAASSKSSKPAVGRPPRPETVITHMPEPDDSEKPTSYAGSLPDITAQHGEYKPRVYDRWHFPATLEAIKSGAAVDVRNIEKACAEAFQNPGRFSDEDISEFAKQIKDQKALINPAYWGDLHAACKRAKEDQAAELIRDLRRHVKNLQQFKEGQVASLDGYGRSNGSGTSSPKAEYGIGPKYDDEVVICQQIIAKAFKITKEKEELLDSVAAAGQDLHEEAINFDKK